MTWCPEGYLTLYEICSQFWVDRNLFRSASDHPNEAIKTRFNDTSLDKLEIAAAENWLLSEFLNLFWRDIRACLPSGNLARLTPMYFYHTDPDSGLNYPRYGGEFPDSYTIRRMISEREFYYISRDFCIIDDDSLGPLRGAPLCILEKRIPTRIENITEWLIEEVSKRSLETEKRLLTTPTEAADIVRAFQFGKLRTKADAKRMYAQNMKHEAWLALWSEVTEIAPDLSRPGPRSSPKQFEN